MTCKDCIHFEVCDSGRHIGEYIQDDAVYTDGVEKQCPTFKSNTQNQTADAVEVVRCKNCRYCSNNPSLDIHRCARFMAIVSPEHFCSLGDRKKELT